MSLGGEGVAVVARDPPAPAMDVVVGAGRAVPVVGRLAEENRVARAVGDRSDGCRCNPAEATGHPARHADHVDHPLGGTEQGLRRVPRRGEVGDRAHAAAVVGVLEPDGRTIEAVARAGGQTADRAVAGAPRFPIIFHYLDNRPSWRRFGEGTFARTRFAAQADLGRNPRGMAGSRFPIPDAAPFGICDWEFPRAAHTAAILRGSTLRARLRRATEATARLRSLPIPGGTGASTASSAPLRGAGPGRGQLVLTLRHPRK
jgi:hypothetical protein